MTSNVHRTKLYSKCYPFSDPQQLHYHHRQQIHHHNKSNNHNNSNNNSSNIITIRNYFSLQQRSCRHPRIHLRVVRMTAILSRPMLIFFRRRCLHQIESKRKCKTLKKISLLYKRKQNKQCLSALPSFVVDVVFSLLLLFFLAVSWSLCLSIYLSNA